MLKSRTASALRRQWVTAGYLALIVAAAALVLVTDYLGPDPGFSTVLLSMVTLPGSALIVALFAVSSSSGVETMTLVTAFLAAGFVQACVLFRLRQRQPPIS